MIAEKIFQNEMANLRSSEKSQKKIMIILQGSSRVFFLKDKYFNRYKYCLYFLYNESQSSPEVFN